jgi:hypothetical protein
MEQTSDFERILLADPHIKKIYYDPAYDKPLINYDLLFAEDYQKSAQKQVDDIFDKLNAPFIEDIFGKDHLSRRGWTTEMSAKRRGIWEYLDQNAFKVNNWGAIFEAINRFRLHIADYIGPELLIFERKLNAVSDLPAVKYNDLEVAQAVEYVSSIRRAAYDVLIFLASV